MVYPGLRRSLRSRLRLRFPARGVAVRIGRGRLVGGRDTALGGRRTFKVNLPPVVATRFLPHFRYNPAIDFQFQDESSDVCWILCVDQQ
jgi:hypothetical protein